MRAPKFVVVTGDGKGLCYHTQDSLIDGFMKKEFGDKDNVYSIRDRLRLQPTAIILETKKPEAGSNTNG